MAKDDAIVSRLLRELSQGTPGALDRLMPVVYDELRRLAHAQLRGERSGHTLNTTALVHETFLRLVKVDHVDVRDRAHFFAVAARVMRRVLIDYARGRSRAKRGNAAVGVPLPETLEAIVGEPGDLLVLEEALTRLEVQNQRHCRVIECRCFAGMSIEETAAALGTSPATVKRDLAFARAWLNRELDLAPADSSGMNTQEDA